MRSRVNIRQPGRAVMDYRSPEEKKKAISRATDDISKGNDSCWLQVPNSLAV